MADFVRRVLRPEQPDFIVRSLLDVDFYKFTMGLFIYRFYRGVNVKFSLINRHTKIPLALVVDEVELRKQLDHVRTLRLHRAGPGSRGSDIYYLRGMDVYGNNMFSEDYLKFLSELSLTPYTLERDGNQYKLSFEGPWEVVTFWETIALAIISELFYRKLMQSMSEVDLHVLYARATDKVYRKLQTLNHRLSIYMADFAQRRRHGFLWQDFVV